MPFDSVPHAESSHNASDWILSLVSYPLLYQLVSGICICWYDSSDTPKQGLSSYLGCKRVLASEMTMEWCCPWPQSSQRKNNAVITVCCIEVKVNEGTITCSGIFIIAFLLDEVVVNSDIFPIHSLVVMLGEIVLRAVPAVHAFVQIG